MSANWTPASTLQRYGPDEWLVFDRGRRIAVIRQVSLGPNRELLYRAVTWAVRSEDRVLIAYLPRLDLAAEIVWREYTAARVRDRESR